MKRKGRKAKRKKVGDEVRGSVARRKGKGKREKKERKERKERKGMEKKKIERKDGRKERRRGIGTNVT